jgi:hypothetical protein
MRVLDVKNTKVTLEITRAELKKIQEGLDSTAVDKDLRMEIYKASHTLRVRKNPIPSQLEKVLKSLNSLLNEQKELMREFLKMGAGKDYIGAYQETVNYLEDCIANA